MTTTNKYNMWRQSSQILYNSRPQVASIVVLHIQMLT